MIVFIDKHLNMILTINKSLLVHLIVYLTLALSTILGPNGQLGLVLVDNIPNNNSIAPYYVGSNHHKWCFEQEREQIYLMASVLSKKRNNCTVVDGGMNDGFYTLLAAAYGCTVYSFELQKRCIDWAYMAAHKSNLLKNINILRRPLSKNNNEVLVIPFPENEGYCDGGFTFSGENKVQRTHAHKQLSQNHTFLSVALDSFIPADTYIDYLKIDVEGHETEVLSGAMNLIKNHRIGELNVELSYFNFYNNVTELFDVYKSIMSLGYKLTTLNCKMGPDTFALKDFEAFKSYFHMSPGKFRCLDLRIHM